MPVVPKDQITPSLIEALYAKHQLRPAPFDFYPGAAGGCCGIGVLAAEAGEGRHRSGVVEWTIKTYGTEFVSSFERGFDSGILGQAQVPNLAKNPVYVLGHKCGAQMAKFWTPPEQR